ncbi:MAG: type transporter [Acidimicrobiales bacterium]|nr:type transporter [Acidimicrobiales bacterium]
MDEPLPGSPEVHPAVTGRERRAGAEVRGRRTRRAWVLELLPIWTIREVRAQYRQSALDLGWSLVTPVVTLVGFGFVLTSAFGVTGDGVPYIVFAWSGLVVWTFVSNALTRGTSSLLWAADIVRKVPFPKEVVPLATVLSAGLDLGIGLVVLVSLMAIQGVRPGWTAIAVVPVLLVMVVWTSALAVLFATITTFVRDLAHGLGVLLRIGIFVTPVMYPVSQVPVRYRPFLRINPVSVYIESIRDAVFRDRWPDWSLIGVHTLVSIGLFVLAVWYLRRVEGRIADVI